MKRRLKNRIFANFIGAFIFGVLYSLISYINKGYVDIDTILITMALYFLMMCLFRFVEAAIGRIAHHEEKSG